MLIFHSTSSRGLTESLGGGPLPSTFGRARVRAAAILICSLVLSTGCSRPGAPPTPSPSPTSSPSPTPTVNTLAPSTTDTEPRVTASPASGPVGSRVRIEGEGFTGDEWRALLGNDPGYGISLLRTIGDCELIAGGAEQIRLDSEGHLEADFIVPRQGSCFQGDRQAAVIPGDYDIIVLCHGCLFGRFRVID